MSPESKVVSLETAKKLKEVGYIQGHTERFWYQYEMERTPDAPFQKGDWELRKSEEWGNGIGEHITAPDVQEIGERLDFKNKNYRVCFTKQYIKDKFSEGDWYYCVRVYRLTPVADGTQVGSGALIYKTRHYEMKTNNEAECRGACWIYLKENKLI